MEELKGKTAIVTGASRGIGASIVDEFVRLGMKVVLAARSADAIDQTAEAIRKAGGDAVAVACDVAVYADLEKAVETCKTHFGQVDILINNAGLIDPIARLGDSDPAEWGKVADVNYKGVYHGIRAVLPEMEARGGGVIVNISSGAATNALEGWSHYCSSKAAVLMLTKCVHKEYGDKGIRVVGLSPGTVATDMQRSIKKSGLNPVSTLNWEDHIAPDWPAKAVAYLCTEAARDLDGDDFALRSEDSRRRVGLI
ncbi:MAG: SDR family oxidoreductase [Alphaproteobacteria bacterium]|nr:SDR family oxidoreductase [Alphaproteobacteria bacterium]